MTQVFDNQEAFVLSAKRIKSRIQRAKELGVDTLDTEGLKTLVEDLSLAKAVETEQLLETVKRGQEYYVQTLIDSLSKTIKELMEIEYNQAMMELGSEEEIMTSLEELQTA